MGTTIVVLVEPYIQVRLQLGKYAVHLLPERCLGRAVFHPAIDLDIADFQAVQTKIRKRRLRKPILDGRTELILTPPELLDRLAYLVTPPRITTSGLRAVCARATSRKRRPSPPAASSMCPRRQR